MKIESYLPVFPGFYNTIFDYANEEDDIEHLIEETGNEELTWDDIEWNYREYHDRVAEACAGAIEHELQTDGWNIKVNFQKLYSPREYNFTTDVIYVEYELPKEEFEKLKQYARDNYEEWKDYLERNFTSRSGFISFFDVNPKTWFEEYLDPEFNRFMTAFAQLLEFYFENEGYTSEDLYYAVDSETGYIDYKLPGE